MSYVEDISNEIELRGWIVLPDFDASRLVGLVEELGSESKVKWIRARPEGDACRRSLSSLHGLAAFPPHTDGAAFAHPPRYVSLLSERTFQAATHLIDGEDVALGGPAFSRSWLVRAGRRSFYAVPRRNVDGKAKWRLNPDVMSPADSADVDLAMEAFGSAKRLRIEWKPGLAVIWDNERMLHAREAVSGEERELLRVSVSL